MKNYDLSLLDICPVGATFILHSSDWKFRRPSSPLDYSVLLNNLCLVLPPQMHLLDCDPLPIQSPLHPSSFLLIQPRLMASCSWIMGVYFGKLVLLVLAFSEVTRAWSVAPQVPCFFIFGDSLVDNGNNNNILTLARANYRPYGVDFAEGSSGRFTNGRTMVDVLGNPALIHVPAGCSSL
ncbi:hypothetical protein BHM03_00047655 [Ensete ventricosum]|nr:hypothetical protein BHM03_00047655 [Ensete ventricosum]